MTGFERWAPNQDSKAKRIRCATPRPSVPPNQASRVYILSDITRTNKLRVPYSYRERRRASSHPRENPQLTKYLSFARSRIIAVTALPPTQRLSCSRHSRARKISLQNAADISQDLRPLARLDDSNYCRDGHRCWQGVGECGVTLSCTKPHVYERPAT